MRLITSNCNYLIWQYRAYPIIYSYTIPIMAASKKQHLTQQWYDKLFNELTELRDVKLPDVIKKLTEASEQWDISENAEYDDALARKDLLEARISEIDLLLQDVEIIKKKKTTASTTVWYGSVVEVEFDDGKVEKIEIVWSWEVSVEDTLKISFESPVWTAIRNKKVGEKVRVRLAWSRKEVTIKSIS